MLNDLDGVEIVSARDFFAIAAYKKCLRVVVSVQDYLATVVLLEKSLSSWETQKGLSDAADSLGLLDKTKASAWEVSRLRDSQVPRCVFVATALLRLVALCSCYIIGAQIGGRRNNSPDPVFGLYCYLDADWLFCYESELDLRRLAMTLPFLTCFLILLWDILCCCCCCLCCCKHRRGFKIRPRPTQLWYRKYLGVQGCHYAFKVAALQFLTVVMQGLAKASLFRTIQDTHGPEALQASTAVHCFMVLLLCNILFPAMILGIPNYVFSRVGAALLDAVLDVGYMVTSILLYIVFATTESLTAIFVNSAHQRVRSVSLRGNRLTQLPEGLFRDLLLYQYMIDTIDLADNRIAALPRTVFQSGSSLYLFDELHLEGNCLTTLPPGVFEGLFFYSNGILNISHNKLQALHADTFHGLTFGDDGILDMSQNTLQELHADTFHGLTFGQSGILDMSQNTLQELHAKTFEGLTFGYKGILDMSQNKLQVLHAEAFQNLTFGWKGILNMSQNKLQELHVETFHGLTFGGEGILDMSQNTLQELHADTFHGLTFGQSGILDMSQNTLQELHADTFHGLTFGQSGILDMSQNTLQELHAKTFEGLTFGYKGILDMSQN
eukprot:s3258_g1.t1